jgi:hypothetical protein
MLSVYLTMGDKRLSLGSRIKLEEEFTLFHYPAIVPPAPVMQYSKIAMKSKASSSSSVSLRMYSVDTQCPHLLDFLPQ